MSTYRAWDPVNSTEADGRDIEAFGSGEAAETFAHREDWQGAEYIYASEGGQVCVRAPDGSVETFDITAETTPKYIATRRPTDESAGGDSHD